MNAIARRFRWVALIGLPVCLATVVHAQPEAPVDTVFQAASASAGVVLQTPSPGADAGTARPTLALNRWSAPGSTGAGFLYGLQATRFDGTGMGASFWNPQFGLQWTSALSGRWQVRVSSWADLPTGAYATGLPAGFQNGQMLYTAQVQVQWASARYGGLLPEYGAIGVQLQGGSRLLLRARHGGPMVYYRTRF